MTDANRRGVRSAQVAILVNTALAIAKLVAGLVGHTYALVADAVESTADILSSTVVWGGLRVAARDPDEAYRFGDGKAEPLAASVVSLMLLGAAVGIALEAVSEIRTRHHVPAPWTLELGYRVTIHVQADATMSLHDSHALSGAVKAAVRDAVPQVQYVLVHMEPFATAAVHPGS